MRCSFISMIISGQIRRILQNMRIGQIPRLLTDWNQNFFPSLATQKSKFVKTGDSEDRYDYYYNVHTGKSGELYYTKEEFRKMNEKANGMRYSGCSGVRSPGHSAAYTKYVHDQSGRK